MRALHVPDVELLLSPDIDESCMHTLSEINVELMGSDSSETLVEVRSFC